MRTGSFKVIFAGKMAIYAAVLPENSCKFQCYFDLENIYCVKKQLCFNWAYESSTQISGKTTFLRCFLDFGCPDLDLRRERTMYRAEGRDF